MNNKLGDFITKFLDERGWSGAELSRRAGIHNGSLSNVVNGNRNPGPSLVRKLARVLELPEAEIFRLAGIMSDPHLTEESQSYRAVIEKLEMLNQDEQEELSDYIDYIIFGRKKRGGPTTRKSGEATDPGNTK